MVTTVVLEASVEPTKFCNMRSLVEVGAGTVPVCGSSTYAAQYTVPGALSCAVTARELVVDCTDRERKEGAGIKSV